MEWSEINEMRRLAASGDGETLHRMAFIAESDPGMQGSAFVMLLSVHGRLNMLNPDELAPFALYTLLAVAEERCIGSYIPIALRLDDEGQAWQFRARAISYLAVAGYERERLAPRFQRLEASVPTFFPTTSGGVPHLSFLNRVEAETELERVRDLIFSRKDDQDV